jgi:hypothetical protein
MSRQGGGTETGGKNGFVCRDPKHPRPVLNPSPENLLLHRVRHESLADPNRIAAAGVMVAH